jgi:predicted nuclease of predicted toxin-antitoxin system
MARLYADEQFPFAVVKLLQEMGHDVLRVQDVRQAGLKIPDISVLNFATENNRAVLTLNRTDFIKLHYSKANHAGIIVCRDDRNWQKFAERINDAILSFKSLDGKLIRVNRNFPT